MFRGLVSHLRPFICTALFATSAFSQVQKAILPDEKSETAKWREDLAYMARQMESTHRDLFHTIPRAEFETAVKRLDESIPRLQRHQIIVEMMRIAAMIGDGHTNVYPTRDAKIGFHTLPVQLYLFDDGLFVRAAAKEQTELVGARVLRIGKATVEDAVARVAPLIGRDNEMGVRFFAPYLLAMPEVLNALGLSDSVESVEITVEKAGRQKTVALKPYGPVEILPADTDMSWMPKEGWVDLRDTAAEKPLWLRDPKNTFWFEYLPDAKTVYAQINQVGDKKDETLADFSKRLLAFVEANAAEKLILDFRLNRGGNGGLLKPLEVSLLKSRIDQPGKLFILMGRSTWSASQFFLNWMQKYSNAVFVGEPSASKGNVYGDSRRIILPNSGITVRVSVYYWQDWDPWDTRTWTAPTVAADLSSEDYRNGRDPALKAALEYKPQKPLAELLGESLTNGGTAAATQTFSRFKADPRNRYADTEEALLAVGQRLLNEKKPAEALELFKLVQKESPGSFRAYFALGVAYSQTGNRELAESNLKRALELNPKSYDVAEALRQLNSK